MVLIFSISNDGTTTDVMKWLNQLGVNTLRINGDVQSIKLFSLDINSGDIIIEVDGKKHNLNKYETVWYRKFGLSLSKHLPSSKDIKTNSRNDKELEHAIQRNLQNENRVLINYIHFWLERKKSVGKRHNSNLNKLVVLQKALELGLKIPNTRVVSSKSELKNSLENSRGLITKAISDGIYTFSEKKSYYTYTESVNKKLLNSTLKSNSFFPSLIQEKINKEFELRIFYLKGKFYSMAIFSQNDNQTKVDYRKYNNEKPNRTVPFQLPEKIESQLNLLMTTLDLDTGSIDMIVDSFGNYIFLEINPVGQFGMTSRPCNYYLEKEMALCLT